MELLAQKPLGYSPQRLPPELGGSFLISSDLWNTLGQPGLEPGSPAVPVICEPPIVLFISVKNWEKQSTYSVGFFFLNYFLSIFIQDFSRC